MTEIYINDQIKNKYNNSPLDWVLYKPHFKQTNKSSKYIGVSLNKRYNKWQSEITHQNKKYSLGSFKDEKQAAEAYNKKAVELYGEFANLNEFP